MALSLFKDKQKDKLTPVLRATLLSSSFDSWRRRTYRAPLYRPPEAERVMPLSVRGITPHFARAHDDAGYDFVHHLVCREMEDCDSACHEQFRRKTERQLKFDRTEALESLRLNGSQAKFASAIDFDPDSDITAVSVGSIVYGVTEEQARALVDRADPPNWPKSPGDFFKKVTRGVLVRDTFKPDDSVEKDEPYQIQEEVEWHWGPQLESTGSMVNVLEIANQPDKLSTRSDAQKHVEAVFRACDPDKKDATKYEPELEPAYRTDYTYRLVRCMKSKLLSSWVPGGLDADDGRYVAMWCRAPGALKGAFLTTIQKQIHFSRAADRDAFPQFSQLLNLLAPAVITLLLKELAFNSTLAYLHDQPNGGTT